MPSSATAPLHIEDSATGLGVSITLAGAQDVPAQAADGYLVYALGHGSGTTLLYRPTLEGVEDFVSFDSRPTVPEIAYQVTIGGGIQGLRLVENTLEMVDSAGTPRLRVAPPSLVAADGARIDATLALEGCAYDNDPAPPWGRAPVPAGAGVCTVRVSWSDAGVKYPALLDPRWTTTMSMGTARQGHTATVLSTGKVLVVGGGSSSSTAFSTAELFDRTTGTWAATGSMTAGPRQLHTAVQLGSSSNPNTSGKVLVAGGWSGSATINSAQLYSPSAGTWMAATNMNAARHAHAAAVLADGRVLVAGGLNGTMTQTSAAIFNPASGTGAWAATTGPLPPTGQKYQTATLLVTSNAQLNNKVLLVGGNSGSGTLSATYLFDPAQSAFSTLSSMPSPHEGHTATVLPNGKLLITGGRNGSATVSTTAIFDPSFGPGSWSTGPAMTTARQGHTATLLASGVVSAGQVLVAGGSNGTSTLSSAELFNGTNAWTATTAMPAPVQGHTASLLPNGAVLIAGGVNGTTTAAARIYDASFGLSCTSSSQCTTGFCVSGVCCDTACTGQCTACNLAGLVGTCSPRPNGTSCADTNICNGVETCQAGACAPGTPPTCSDACHQAGTCDPVSGCTLGPPKDGIGCNISLRLDGVVDLGNGVIMAVFGHNSSAAAPFHPAANTVSFNGVVVSNPQPAPPAYLAPGNHPGSFLPTFASGQTIAWTADSQSLSASWATTTHLTPVPFGTDGQKVTIGGVDVIVRPDVGKYAMPPPAPDPNPESEPMLGNVFNGTIKGTLGVSPSGAATYTVPISIPPGISGMAPNLSLVYNSQGGDGLAGQGWELSGLSSIHRCPKTRAQDGHARPIVMDPFGGAEADSDGVCLDGQRLFETSPNSGFFVPEHPTFDLIQRVGDGFLVVTKAAEKRWYGTSAASRIVGARGSLDPLSTPVSGTETAAWALDKVEDQWGNYYTVHYNSSDTDNAADFLTNGVLVTRIEYTGHSSGTTQTSPFNSIKFDYEQRSDVRWTRFGATRIPKKNRLFRIRTSPTQVYELTYADPDLMLPSRLLKISYCSTETSPPSCLKDLEFDWGPPISLSWTEDVRYRVPYSIDSDVDNSSVNPGTQLIDLNGDGRLDFVRQEWYWLNKPGGFSDDLNKDGDLPEKIVNTDGNGTIFAQFADLDGDGRPDLVTSDKVYLNRFKTGGTWEQTTSFSSSPRDFNRANNPDRLADVNGDGFADLILSNHALPGSILTVYLNNNGTTWAIPSGGTHSFNGSVVGPSSEYILPAAVDLANYDLRDVNRDGLVDLVQRTATPDSGHYMVRALTNTGSALTGDAWFFAKPNCPNPPDDCLPDDYDTYTSVWKAGRYEVGSGDAFPESSRFRGDVDGDGLLDSIVYSPRIECIDVCDPPGSETCQCTGYKVSGIDVRVELSTGNGYQQGVASGYAGVLNSIAASHTSQDPLTIDPRVTFADVNGDGLIDLLTLADKQLWLNNGSTWVVAPSGSSPPLIPSRPARIPVKSDVVSAVYVVHDNGVTFADMDGDGMADLVQASDDGAGNTRRTWRNGFRRPVIKGFPNSLARPSNVTYAIPTTTNAVGVYSDDQDPLPGTAYVMPPFSIVASVDEDDGVGGSAKTTYSYKNLRASRHGRGLLGFQEITSVGQGKITTRTTYSQVYPYAGMPTKIERFVQGAYKISNTETEYCDVLEAGDHCTHGTGPGGAPSKPGPYGFVYPISVTDTAFLYDSKDGGFVSSTPVARIETITGNRYDASGNPTHVGITTCRSPGAAPCSSTDEKYSKTADYEYGPAGGTLERRGKVRKSTVTAQRLQPLDAARTHVRQFDYGIVLPGAAALSASPPPPAPPLIKLEKEELEPGAGGTIELDTAYTYDDFGNVVTTTVCPGNFANCAYATNDATFRKSTVSFEPGSFVAPSGTGLVTSLPYGPGRFPVASTNALGHATYFVYDGRFGTEIQTTDPNGVTTCQNFDGLGQKTSVTERCGVAPLTTLLARFHAATGDPGAVVTRTMLPTGVYSYVYTDVRGRTVETRSRTFDGTFVKTQTIYDSLGRVQQASKPFAALGSPKWTTTYYDWLSRPWNVAQDLDDIDGSGSAATSSMKIEYNGAEAITTETLTHTGKTAAETHVRHETKNLLGKVATVIDARGKSASYAYDADSNLVSSTDSAQNVVSVIYDVRGRKTDSYDPDMGHWHYEYTAFGELATQIAPTQIDPMHPPTTMTYDALGRLRTQTDSSGTAEWVYDVPISPGASIGRLSATVSAPGAFSGSCTVPNVTIANGLRAARWYTYDAFGNVKDQNECADGSTFTTSFGYDGFGRLEKTTYPDLGDGTRFKLQSTYTSFGFLHYVADPTIQNGVYWAATSMNALGQVTGEQTRNGVETVVGRNPSTGWMQTIRARRWRKGGSGFRIGPIAMTRRGTSGSDCEPIRSTR